MSKEIIMRGQTADGGTETINITGIKPGYGYQLKSFEIYPSQAIGTDNTEQCASLTSSLTSENPVQPNFNNEALIGTVTLFMGRYGEEMAPGSVSVINDLMPLRHDLTLAVQDTLNSYPVNWQLRFKEIKLSTAAEAVANFRQFTINDG